MIEKKDAQADDQYGNTDQRRRRPLKPLIQQNAQYENAGPGNQDQNTGLPLVKGDLSVIRPGSDRADHGNTDEKQQRPDGLLMHNALPGKGEINRQRAGQVRGKNRQRYKDPLFPCPGIKKAKSRDSNKITNFVQY